MKKNEPICQMCPGKKQCSWLCPPLQWIGGNKPSKERLFRDICKHDAAFKDYKEILTEMIEDHEVDINKIAEIPDMRTRAIAAMLYVWIPKEEIARQLGISSRQLRRRTNGK